MRSLAALLATSLARSNALRVVSGPAQRIAAPRWRGRQHRSRLYHRGTACGCARLIDGSLFDPGDGTLRLDLRRVDVATGSVLAARTSRGHDLFALADSGTAQLLDGFGIEAPAGSVRDVTTRSAVAHRFYAEGLRANASYDLEAARRLFGEALRADSQFAMAAYEYARANPNRAELAEEMERALRLAQRATPRERLLIRAGGPPRCRSPVSKPPTRYALDPNDPQALLYAAEARLNLGMPAEARPLPNVYSCSIRRHLARCVRTLSCLRSGATAVPRVSTTTIRRWPSPPPDTGWIDSPSAEAWAFIRALDFTGRLTEVEQALIMLVLNPAYPGFVRHASATCCVMRNWTRRLDWHASRSRWPRWISV